MNPVDITLYGIVDPMHCGGRPIDAVAQHAMAGGASAIQYRDKTASTRVMVEHARDLKAALWGSAVPLIINDRVDVAQVVDAEGVHLGQDDMHPEDARAILGDHAIIGMSVKTPEDAGTTPLACVDYVFIGGVFDTVSKDNPASIGLDGWDELAAIIRARKPGIPVGGHCRHQRKQRRRRDRRRRRWRCRHLGDLHGRRRGGRGAVPAPADRL